MKAKADQRLELARAYRQMEADAEPHERDVMRWRIDQIITTASLLGKDIADIGRWDIIWCNAQYGRPSLQEPLRRHDRRFSAA